MDVLNNGEQPKFAKPIFLNFDGFGIRSIEYGKGFMASLFLPQMNVNRLRSVFYH